MARVSAPKRIIKDDYSEEDKDLIDKLGASINTFYDEVHRAFQGNINNDNLARETITVNVENLSTGALKAEVQFKTALTSRILGINCIQAVNTTNTSVYPTGAPFVSWTVSGSIVTIKNITGLQAANKYQITLEIIT